MKQDQLILLCDQLQRDALDIYGGPVKTTAWASLADSGVVFDRCYCATPLCVPSRGSMMTGRWPHAHGATCFGGEYEILNRGEELLIDKLHDAGYHIAYDGIWHINRAAGEDRSSEYTHFVAGTFPYEYHERMRSAQRMTGGSAVQVRTPSDEGIEEWTFSVPVPSRWTRPVREHPDMKTAQRIADFILAMPDGESFAAWCSFGAPHPPLMVPGPYLDLFRPEDMRPPPGFGEGSSGMPRAVTEHAAGYQAVRDWDWEMWSQAIAAYYGYVAFADACMQIVLDALVTSGRRANTVVAATADHGEMLGAHNLYQKSVMYDRACGVPLALSGPNTTPGRFAHPVSHVDLAPTLLDMLGLPQLARSQGRSLVKTLKSDEDAPEYVFIEFNGDVNGGRKIRAVVSGRYKYVYHHQDRDQLFDLQDDPGEVNNLVGDSRLAEELALLRGALVGWMKHTGDSLPADFSSVSMRPDIPQDPGS